jgi:hypothetical protein
LKSSFNLNEIGVRAMADKDSKAAGHEATGSFAFVPPNRAPYTPSGAVELAQRWALLQPDYGS